MKSFSLGTGVGTSGVDQLDLTGTTIAANTGVNGINGTDSLNLRSHSITNGIVSFGSSDTYTTPVTIASADLPNVFAYLQTNIADGSTMAFVTADGNTFVFQDGGANDTIVELIGVNATSVSHTGTVAGSVWIV